MSEFKFACPNCGQHITADTSASGGQLECPTCFRKIIVPQAPESGESKFILSASQADRPRPPRFIPAPSPEFGDPSRSSLRAAAITALAVAFCCGVGATVFWGKIFPSDQGRNEKAASTKKGRGSFRTTHPIPKNVKWTLDLAKGVVPESVAAGSIHGTGFLCEHASLQGNNLTLRHGWFGPVETGLSVWLPPQPIQELSGKTIEVTKDQGAQVPRITVHWQSGNQASGTTNYDKGYAMRLVFDSVVNGRLPGRIFLSLPDAEKSVVAGTFEAELRMPGMPGPPGMPGMPGGTRRGGGGPRGN